MVIVLVFFIMMRALNLICPSCSFFALLSSLFLFSEAIPLPESQPGMEVSWGEKPIDLNSMIPGMPPILHHWALRVNGTTWFEIYPTAEDVAQHLYIPNKILESSPENANISEGRTVLQKQIGFTLNSWEEIREFNVNYVEENPLFWPMSSNCQKYVLSLASFLIGKEKALDSLPPLEADLGRPYVKAGVNVVGLVSPEVGGLLDALTNRNLPQLAF